MIPELTYLDEILYQNKKTFPQEIVYEITTVKNNLSWGIAIVDIAESKLHVHKNPFECYVVLEGDLELTLDNHKIRLHPKDYVLFPSESHIE